MVYEYLEGCILPATVTLSLCSCYIRRFSMSHLRLAEKEKEVPFGLKWKNPRNKSCAKFFPPDPRTVRVTGTFTMSCLVGGMLHCRTYLLVPVSGREICESIS